MAIAPTCSTWSGRLNATHGWDAPTAATRATSALQQLDGGQAARVLLWEFLQWHRYAVTTPSDQSVLRHVPDVSNSMDMSHARAALSAEEQQQHRRLGRQHRTPSDRAPSHQPPHQTRQPPWTTRVPTARAVVWVGGDARTAFMYQPAARTLSAGLRLAFGNVTMGQGARQLGSTLATWRLSAGDALVWVGIADFGSILQRTITDLTAHGVFTVFYATEAAEVFDQQCALQSRLDVSEIWHYARSNLASCSPEIIGKPARYVPPGFHKPSRLAASALPSSQQAATLVASNHSLVASNHSWLLFPGATRLFYASRRRCLDSIQHELAKGAGLRVVAGSARQAGRPRYQCAAAEGAARALHSTAACPLANTDKLHNEASWEQKIAQYGIFLSVHKECADKSSRRGTNGGSGGPAARSGAAETFRFAPLLSAGGIVVSEQAHAIDEEELTRFVTFAPAHELASLALAEAGRRSLSAAAVQRRAGAYAQSFNPEAIFVRAGLWRR